MRYLLLLSSLLLAACGMREDTAVIYHRDSISQDQYLQDQVTLRNTPGVIRVIGKREGSGAATLDVHIKEGYDLLIQEKMSGMGWQGGRH